MAMQTVAGGVHLSSVGALVCFSQISRPDLRRLLHHPLLCKVGSLRLGISKTSTCKKQSLVAVISQASEAVTLKVPEEVISMRVAVQGVDTGNPFSQEGSEAVTSQVPEEMITMGVEVQGADAGSPLSHVSIEGSLPLVAPKQSFSQFEGSSLPSASTQILPVEGYNFNQSIDSVTSRSEMVNATIESTLQTPDIARDSMLNEQAKTAKELYEALLAGKGSLGYSESSVDENLLEVKSTFLNSISRVQDFINSVLEEARNTSMTVYSNVNGSILDFLKHLSGSSESSTLTSGPTVSYKASNGGSFLDAMRSPLEMGTPPNNFLKGLVTRVGDLVHMTLTATGDVVGKGYVTAKEALPAELRLYLDKVDKSLGDFAGPLNSAFQQVYLVIVDAEKTFGIDPENPVIPVVVVIGGTFLLGVLYWQSQYGGYSGDLTPASALELLKNESNVLLIDTRSEGARQCEGIPDLRRQVRSKIVNVESAKIQAAQQKLLKKTAKAESEITAIIIKNLKNVQRSTKVIVMDMDGSQSKSIARALRKFGIKMPYRINGGFRAWKADGLRVKEIGPETTLSILKEETEAILEEVKPSVSGLISITLGAFVSVYAIVEWEKTLQLLGVICIGQVLFTRLSSYDSVEDAKNDLRVLSRPFSLAIQAITWVSRHLEPSKLQLATSPSTSAVQDRVLQAAAKHGTLASEVGEDGQPPSVHRKEETAGIAETVSNPE